MGRWDLYFIEHKLPYHGESRDSEGPVHLGVRRIFIVTYNITNQVVVLRHSDNLKPNKGVKN